MKLWLRLLYQLVSWQRRTKISISDVAKRRFRVWPTDLDIYNHMNNGVFLTILDLGRYDHGKRTGIWNQWKKIGWYPVVVAENITFRKSLKLWQSFDLESKVIGWSDEAFYFEQRFVVGEEIYARAVVRIRFLKRSRGIVTPQEILGVTPWHGPVPTLPEWVTNWSKESALPKGREPAPSDWDS
jgi:acyl-CoA thioesterase FadM